MSTSEAQKRALKKYYEKTKSNQKRITVSMTAAEYDVSRATLKANGLTPLQAWRRLMSELNAAPVNPSESESTGETAPTD